MQIICCQRQQSFFALRFADQLRAYEQVICIEAAGDADGEQSGDELADHLASQYGIQNAYF